MAPLGSLFYLMSKFFGTDDRNLDFLYGLNRRQILFNIKYIYLELKIIHNYEPASLCNH